MNLYILLYDKIQQQIINNTQFKITFIFLKLHVLQKRKDETFTKKKNIQYIEKLKA